MYRRNTLISILVVALCFQKLLSQNEKYHGGSFDGFSFQSLALGSLNGATMQPAKYFGLSYDGSIGATAALSSLGGVTLASEKHHGGSYDGYLATGSLLTNPSGSSIMLEKYLGGGHDGSVVGSSLFSNLAGVTTNFAKYNGGPYDGYMNVNSPATNLTGITATLAKYSGSAFDGYASNNSLLTSVSGIVSTLAKHHGGSLDGHGLGYSARSSLAGMVEVAAKYFGHSYDGYSSGVGGTLQINLTGLKYLGGSFDGYGSVSSLLSNFAGGTLDFTKYLGGGLGGYSAAISGENSALPIQIVSFAATASRLDAVLQWKTLTEVNNNGFEIERGAVSNQQTAVSWQKVGFVASSGTSSSRHEYNFIDRNLSPGRYAYRLKQVDNDGTFSYSGSAEVEIGLAAKEFNLESNYPNPFNPATTIQFTLAENGKATLRVFNTLGQQVATLFDGEAQAGRVQQVKFDASKLPSGLYFAKLEAGNQKMMHKMVLLR